MRSRSRVVAGVATLAVVGGLTVAAVAVAHPERARLPGAAAVASAAAEPPSTPTPSSSPTGFATLAPEDLPTPDVPDASVVHRVGPQRRLGPGAHLRADHPPGRPAGRGAHPGHRRRLAPRRAGHRRPTGRWRCPRDFGRAGWLVDAPAPGQRGPAVIAGHVDSRDGPAVFYRLHELEPGDEVEVVQRDGDVLTFTVRSLRSFAKDHFPTELVYGPAPGPVLRLITCSGEVDPVSGHYVDNTVVFAS